MEKDWHVADFGWLGGAIAGGLIEVAAIAENDLPSPALAGQHCADQLSRAGRQGQSDVPMPEGKDDVPAAF